MRPRFFLQRMATSVNVAVWTMMSTIAAVIVVAGPHPGWADDPPSPQAAVSTSSDDPQHAERGARGLKLFDQQVAALLEARCIQCHRSEELSGGLSLATRESLLKGGEHGPAVVDGRGDQSLLVKLVRHQLEPAMPEEGEPLTKAEIQSLVDWINAGAPYGRRLGSERPGVPSWTQKSVETVDREFWSFRPLQPVVVPDLPDDLRSYGPVDRFVQAAQAQHGVSLAESADRRTLIRRVTYDITGLPPSVELLQRAMTDDSPLWYERLVDELLANPHYGETWGRYWLDLARFAESHGFEHDYDRPTAYHYRDFVIQAFNQNLPYSQFVAWQLAGDELAPADRLAQMATGFLAAGVHSTQITANEAEKHRYDEMDDMLATTGTAFLGLTIGCARCHDHKYDPIPQADYYRLLATFTQAVRSEVELDFDPEGYARAAAEFALLQAPFDAAVTADEANELPARYTRWQESQQGQWPRDAWLLPFDVQLASQAGVTFQPLADGSWLAQGTPGETDVYTITGRTRLPGITALRLEALTDMSLQHGGPGRAGNGNFALSKLELDVRVVGASVWTPVALGTPLATFEQIGLPIAAALDDQPGSAWAVDPQFGRDHAAVFPFVQPWAAAEHEFRVKLHFFCNTQHSIGRVRMSFSERDERPVMASTPFSETLLELLPQPLSNLSEPDRRQVLEWFKPRDERWMQLETARREHAARAPKPDIRKVLVTTEGLPPIRLHTQAEQEFLPATHFLRRGDPNLKDGIATPGVLQVLLTNHDHSSASTLSSSLGSALNSTATLIPTSSQGPVDPSGNSVPARRTSLQRSALAAWLTDPHTGAGVLAARVWVNRLWQHHFGRGIVSTPSDFGRRGAAPTHPELLEWLTNDLLQTGGNTKAMHRQLVLSAAYRQSAQAAADTHAADPDNVWLTRHAVRRLPAEAIRDAARLSAEQLDDRMYGPGSLDLQQPRRSVYFTIKRSQLIPAMSVFDAPDGTTPIGERPQTTIAPQALALLNGTVHRQAAQQLAAVIQPQNSSDWPAAVEQAYLRVLQRPPSSAELDAAGQFLGVSQIAKASGSAVATSTNVGSSGIASADAATVWTDFCHVLLCLNETIYVD
jgi:mono/diheme cytochrome c family protein